jgi:hypothetical protein
VIIRRISVVAFVVVGLVAGATTGASAATVSPSKWAPKFCTALSEWQTTIQEKGDALTTALDDVDSTGQTAESILSDARDQIASFLGDMVDATDDATDAIKAAGSPSSPNGGKISALFVSGFKSISKEFAKAQSKAEDLPTDSVTAFKTKGKQLGQALSDSGDTLGKGFGSIDKLDKGKKLEAAVKAAPECSFLT